ncbi:MAG TPA: redoxin domain-containing protein [Gemmatimonadales bacterium]
MHAYRDQYAQLFRDGREIILIAISTDAAQAQFEWARDDEFQFLFGSDESAEVGKLYGAWQTTRSGDAIDNRSVFVVNPDGAIEYVAAPFREIDPTAYEELDEAIKRIAPPLKVEG